MDYCGGSAVAFVGLLFTLAIGTAMGADPLVGAIVLAIIFVSVCLTGSNN